MTLAASKPSHADARSGASSDAGSGEERLGFAVIGGGISGLALATWLRAEGVEVTVLDKSSRPGGVIGTVREEGFTFERGPSTILDKCDAVNEIIDLAGLSDQVIRSPMRDHERYIWRAGRLHAVPMGPGGLIGTKLITAGAKARLLREPFVAPEQADEPLSEFISRRLGPEIYERAFIPMVSGLSAGDPARMSTAASFPFLKELERLGGSLIKGALKKRKADRQSASGPPQKRVRNIVNFTEGLASLPAALADRLGGSYVAEVDVKSIEPNGGTDGFLIRASHRGNDRVWRADRLAMCGDNLAVANWLEGFEPEAAGRLRSIHYCALAVIGLGVEATSLSIPPGFGFLTVRDEGVRVLGSIFQSNVLPNRAPEGCAALSVMVGGDLDPEGAALDDDELMDVVRRDLKTVLGWDGRLKHCLIQRWPRAIPRYGLDYFEIVEALEAVEARRPGLRLFGNWREGTAIGDRIDQAKRLAIEISKETAPAVG